MRQVRDLLRGWGYTVEEVPGWESRGSGTFAAIIGQANHHDAFPLYDRRGNFLGHAAGLRTCTFGRPDLRNSLCMFYLGSDGVVYLVAAKPSWHTGRAAWRGRSWPNSRVSGIEARNDGLGEPWPAVQADAYAALNTATAIVFGFDERDVADHKEIAIPAGRKIDRTGINPPAWRHRVRGLLAVPPTPPLEEDHMIPYDKPHPDARGVRKLVNHFFTVTGTGGPPHTGWLPDRDVIDLAAASAITEALQRLADPGWWGSGVGPADLIAEGVDVDWIREHGVGLAITTALGTGIAIGVSRGTGRAA